MRWYAEAYHRTVRACGWPGVLARRLAEEAPSLGVSVCHEAQHMAAPVVRVPSPKHAMPMHAQWIVWDPGKHGVHVPALAAVANNQGATPSQRKVQMVAFSVPRQSRSRAAPSHAQ